MYDEEEKEFKPDNNCNAFPDISHITCRCIGASTHSTVVLPFTNKIDFHMIFKRLAANRTPLILMITLVVIFFILTAMALLMDYLDQKRFGPHVC